MYQLISRLNKPSLTLQISYEYLIVALGLQLHYEKVRLVYKPYLCLLKSVTYPAPIVSTHKGQRTTRGV